MIRRLLVALAALCLAPASAAQPVPLDHLPALRGGYVRLDSATLGRPFHIYVRLPQDYAAEPDRRYPVVYLLDGDSLFPLLAAHHLFLTFDERLPEAIVVGIAYGSFDPAVNRRHIDFTPPADGVAPAEAGAPAFQRFLKDELIPLVERAYRADPSRRILFGQSRGGTFVLYSAFTDPDLFWGRIASNPAIAPGRTMFFGPAPAPTGRDLRLVVTSGSRDHPGLREDALRWFNEWDYRMAPWAIRTISVAGGTHAASSPDSYRAGMLWLFDLTRDPPD